MRSDRELSRYTDWSLIDELRRDETRSRMAETEIAQPANFAVQIALAEQLAQFGIEPDAVIGHSAGEVAAHHLAGLLTFEQAIQVIYHRSRLQQRTSGQGRMLAVGLDAESLMETIDETVLDEFGRRISVAAINSPSAVTVAGDGDVLDDIRRQLDEAEIFNRYLSGKCSVSHPLHGCGEGRPLQRLRKFVFESRHAAAVFDGHRRTAGRIRRRRRLLVAEHPRHRSVRTGDPPNAGGRVHPLRRAGPHPCSGSGRSSKPLEARGFR